MTLATEAGLTTATWWLVGVTGALAIAAWIALLGLLDARKTRHASVIAELSARWDDPWVQRSYALSSRYGPEGLVNLVRALWADNVVQPSDADIVDWGRLCVYPNLLEAIALHLDDGAISESIVYRLWGDNMIRAWERWSDAIREARRLTRTPELWASLEDCAIAMAGRLAWERYSEPRSLRDWGVLYLRFIGVLSDKKAYRQDARTYGL